MQSQYFSPIKNTLTIIALFVGLTEIGLGLVIIWADLPEFLLYMLTIFLILFPFVVAVLFFYVLITRYQHFYGPGDFRSDEGFLKTLEHNRLLKNSLAESSKEDLISDGKVLSLLIDNLQDSFCFFLLKIFNKPLTLDEVFGVLAIEMGYQEVSGFDINSPVFGYFMSIANFKGVLYTLTHERPENEEATLENFKLIFSLSPQAVDLISKRFHSRKAELNI